MYDFFMINLTDKNLYTVFEVSGSFKKLKHISDNLQDVQEFIGKKNFEVNKQVCSLERSKERLRQIGHVLILGC